MQDYIQGSEASLRHERILVYQQKGKLLQGKPSFHTKIKSLVNFILENAAKRFTYRKPCVIFHLILISAYLTVLFIFCSILYFVDMFHFTQKEKFPHRHVWMMISPRYSSAVCCVKFGIALNVILPGSHDRFLQGMFDMNDETARQLGKKREEQKTTTQRRFELLVSVG